MCLSVFIRLFYLFQFFFDFIFLYAVEKLFLIDRGLNLSQIGVILTIWSIMTLLLEVPTGTLADKWSRRKMLILSGLFFVCCYSILSISGGFWLVILAFFFRTLGSTFASGTLQAYVFDNLKIHHQEDQFEKIWGRGNAFRTLGIGVAVLCGGFMSEISYQLTVVASAVSVLSLSVIALIWPEIPHLTSTKEEKYWSFLKSSFKVVWNNRTLLKIVLFSGITLTIFASLEEYNDVYLQFLGFPNYMIGIIFAIATVGQSLASVIAHRFKGRVWLTFNLIAITGFVILLLATSVKVPLMAVAILFLGILLEFSQVLSEGVIQKEAPAHQRATISSLNSFIHNILPFQLVFGIVATRYQLQTAYAVLAVGVLMYFGLVAELGRKKQNIRS